VAIAVRRLPVVLRSRRQVVSGVGFGVLIIVLGLLGASQDTYPTGALVDGAAALVIGGALIAMFARTAVVVHDGGVEIRNLNPLFTHTIPWSDIVGFRFGRYRMLNAVCIVDLADGSTQHASAIALSGARRTSGLKEQQMIAFLNEQAAARRGSHPT
jgi:hypothetical protein